MTEQNILTTARKNLEWLSPFVTEHLESDIWDSLHTISYYFSKKQGFLSWLDGIFYHANILNSSYKKGESIIEWIIHYFREVM